MLTVSLSANTGESVALNYALETFTFRGAGNVDPFYRCEICDGDSVSQFEGINVEGLEFHQFALGSGSCLFKMALKSLAGVFL